MKIYIVYYIPDYHGIDILAVFKNEEDAKKYIEKNEADYDSINYYEEEVLTSFNQTL